MRHKLIPKWIVCNTFVAGAVLLAGCGRPREAKSRYADFVKELAPAGDLCELTTAQTSLITSYDRTGENEDYSNFVRREPGWAVLADLEGPGYVSRFWFTGGGAEPRFRFFFDGEKKPRIDVSRDELQAGVDPFRLPLAAWEQNCFYSWAPIPFEKSLVIKATDPGFKRGAWPRLFYQVCYSRLPADKTVQSYPKKLGDEHIEALEAVGKRWDAFVGERTSALDIGHSEPRKAEISPQSRLTIEPGNTRSLPDFTGPAVIRALAITPLLKEIPSAVAREQVLRDVLLKIEWDGCGQTSVAVPLGDFFGSVWRRRRFDCLYFGMRDNTLVSRFPMPFAKSAAISLENQGPRAVSLDLAVEVETLPAWHGNLGYLHACWQRTDSRQLGQPHPILRTTGAGKYVGCILNVAGDDKSWWILEGDELISIDGEKDPSWKGTGLEDYFNGGWYYQNPLARPLHGLLHKSPFRTIQYRLHLTDPVMFEKSIDMTFERGPNHASRGYIESTAFYYMERPAAAAADPGAAENRHEPPDPLETATIMTQLVNRERLDDYRGAYDRIDEFLEANKGFADEEVLRLRQIAYRQRLSGEAGAGAYADFAAAASNQTAVGQAKQLAWFEEEGDRALLGVYCNGRTTVYINGQQVMDVDHPEQLFVRPLVLKPGKHVIGVDTRFTRQNPWVQICLRTHREDVVTAKEWKFTKQAAENWNAADFDDSGWERYTGSGTKGPPEVPFIKLAPNAFVGMQTEALGIRLVNNKPGNNRAWMRKVFVLE